MADPLNYWRTSFETDRTARIVVFDRDPTVYDNTYALGQLWVNEINSSSWQLTSRSAGLAMWEEIDPTPPQPNLGIQYFREITVNGTYDLDLYTLHSIKAPGLVTLRLPSLTTPGASFSVVGRSGSWTIVQAATQQIEFCGMQTSYGLLGSASSTTPFDSISLVCSDTQIFTVISAVGNIDLI